MSPVVPKPPVGRVGVTPDLTSVSFSAETNPMGPAIDLIWNAPPTDPDPEQLVPVILRRERRFPGLGRRGVRPVKATAEDLLDGVSVYNALSLRIDFEETRQEQDGDRIISTTRQYQYAGTPPDRKLVRVIRRVYITGNVTPYQLTVRVIDRQDLTQGKLYYYTAFVATPEALIYSRLTQASALATSQYGYDFFGSLPQIHQKLDTNQPAPFTVARADLLKGQLQRFLDDFQAHTDLFHGSIEGLRDLHDFRRMDSRFLRPMAEMLGWELKDYLDEDGQRNEIVFASDVYRSTGTSPNIAAMVNRLTGWSAQVREYVRNVLMTFDRSRFERLKLNEAIVYPNGMPSATPNVAYLDGSLAVTPAYATYISAPSGPPPGPPFLQARAIPVGSVNTADPLAMFKLRTNAFDDQTAYSYDCGRADGVGGYARDNSIRYNRETIGVYIVPETETEIFSLQQEWDRVEQILDKFFPIQVRAVFVLQPSVTVEQEYNATTMVTEDSSDIAVLLQDEGYGEGLDEEIDRIPGWHWLVTNRLDRRSVNMGVLPVDTNSRTWHTGLAQGI